jgi:drug/metabolite transporter (DMT)-like permease
MTSTIAIAVSTTTRRGLISAALAYATGTAATPQLGSRVGSFVALLEVVAAVLFAWLLLDQRPGFPCCSAAC